LPINLHVFAPLIIQMTLFCTLNAVLLPLSPPQHTISYLKRVLEVIPLFSKLFPVYSLVSTASMKLSSTNSIPTSRVQFFGDVMPCRLLSSTRRFDGTYCLHLQGQSSRLALVIPLNANNVNGRNTAATNTWYIIHSKKKTHNWTGFWDGFTHLPSLGIIDCLEQS
jgi:hypothetical protein